MSRDNSTEQYEAFIDSLHDISSVMDARARAAGASAAYERRLPPVQGSDSDLRLVETSFAEALATVAAPRTATEARMTAVSIHKMQSATRIMISAQWGDGLGNKREDDSLQHFAAVRDVFESPETCAAAKKLIAFLREVIDSEPAAIANVSGDFFSRSNFEIAKADEFAKQLVGFLQEFFAADPVRDGMPWKIITTYHFVPSQISVMVEASAIEIRLL